VSGGETEMIGSGMIRQMWELLAEVRCDLLRGEIECLVVFGDKDLVSFLS